MEQESSKPAHFELSVKDVEATWLEELIYQVENCPARFRSMWPWETDARVHYHTVAHKGVGELNVKFAVDLDSELEPVGSPSVRRDVGG
jgi:hypothetical protein